MPLILNGSTGISGIDGSAGTPSYQGTDSDTGLWYPAANTVALSTSGSERLRIDSSGNVGIGTSTPDIYSTSFARQFTVSTTTASGYSVGTFAGGSGGAGGVEFGNQTVRQAGIYSLDGSALALYTNATNSGTALTERMRITSGGNVGIGTTTITSGAGWSPRLVLDATAAALIVKQSATGQENSFGTGNSLFIDSLGNSTGANNNIIFRNTNVNSSFSALERMRITSDGEVCVNATSAYGSARFYVNAPQPTAANWWVSTLRTASTSIATTMIAFIDGSNDFCGQVYIDPPSNSTVFSTSSDYRLKDNVAPMTGALAKVQALNPVTYTWKKSGKTGQGFIAHELQEIVPECVVGEKDAMMTYTDEEGNEQTAILPQMVDTSFLVATLTAAIKEQQAMIEELKAEVAALKASH